MPISEARKRANRKYDAKAYEQILVRVKAGEKDEIKNYAESQGESINAFICNAIYKAMEKNKTPNNKGD